MLKVSDCDSVHSFPAGKLAPDAIQAFLEELVLQGLVFIKYMCTAAARLACSHAYPPFVICCLQVMHAG